MRTVAVETVHSILMPLNIGAHADDMAHALRVLALYRMSVKMERCNLHVDLDYYLLDPTRLNDLKALAGSVPLAYPTMEGTAAAHTFLVPFTRRTRTTSMA